MACGPPVPASDMPSWSSTFGRRSAGRGSASILVRYVTALSAAPLAVAMIAASASRSIAHSSPIGGAASSCAATRSEEPPASSISFAARLCWSWRSAAGMSCRITSATTGWANPSGEPARRISA